MCSWFWRNKSEVWGSRSENENDRGGFIMSKILNGYEIIFLFESMYLKYLVMEGDKIGL